MYATFCQQYLQVSSYMLKKWRFDILFKEQTIFKLLKKKSPPKSNGTVCFLCFKQRSKPFFRSILKFIKPRQGLFATLSIETKKFQLDLQELAIFSLRDAPGTLRDAPGRRFERAFNCRAMRLYACATRLYTAPDPDPTGCPDSFVRVVLSLQSAAQA